MVYKAFQNTLQESLSKLLGKGYITTIHQVPKNNGVILDGLCIEKVGEKIAPTIYLNSFYDEYQKGAAIDHILSRILALYKENLALPAINFAHLTYFPELKDKIVFKLINADANKKLLTDIPHILYLDMAIVFYLFLDKSKTGHMTALIHNDHMTSWQVSVEKLFLTARLNTPKLLPAVIKNMSEVMREIAKENLSEDYRDDFLDQLLLEENDQTHLYVLSNRSSLNGACCILYDDVLQNFAQRMDTDLIVLPSSIHEVLLIPYGDELDYKDLSDMVTNINQSEVPREDQLSNQVYHYSITKCKLSIVSNSSVPI